MLNIRLYQVALSSLASANKGNPFITKQDAMVLINQSRKALNVKSINIK